MQRVGFVVGKVNAFRLLQQRQYFAKTIAIRIWSLFSGCGWNGINKRMMANQSELFGDPFGRQNEIHMAGRPGATRHAVILSRFQILRKRNTTLRLNGLQSKRPIGIRTR